MVVANLRLTDPAPPSDTDSPSLGHQIRALVTDAEAVKTLLRSMDGGEARIIITPTITEGADSTLSIDLAFRCETADVEGADEFRRLWEGVIQRSAQFFPEGLGLSIEKEIRKDL